MKTTNLSTLYTSVPHFEWTFKALEAEKHVPLEKPFTPTPNQPPSRLSTPGLPHRVLIYESTWVCSPPCGSNIHSHRVVAIWRETSSAVILLVVEGRSVGKLRSIHNLPEQTTFFCSTGFLTPTRLLWLQRKIRAACFTRMPLIHRQWILRWFPHTPSPFSPRVRWPQ